MTDGRDPDQLEALRRSAHDGARPSPAEGGGDREERLLRALGSAAVGWWEWDLATDTVIGNDQLARDFGLDPELAASGLPIDSFFANVHPHDRPLLIQAVEEAVATGQPFREEYRVLGADRVRWVSARGCCLRDMDGKPSKFPGVVIDISDRKAAEEQMREADTGRELALSAARLGRWDHRPDTGARFYDVRALELLGFPPGRTPELDDAFSNLHPSDRERVGEARRAAVDPNRAGYFRETFRVLNMATGAERWVSAMGRTHFSDGVCVRFMGVLSDVSEAMAAQAHRQLLTAELNHRVKNSLAVALSIADSTLRTATDLASARRDISARLVNYGKAHDILTATSWSAATVPKIVAAMAESLGLPSNRLERAGEAVQLGPKPALQLSLALHELATNALKYGALSNDDGRVALTWGVNLEDDRRIFRFEWAERGGPGVTSPVRRGFGSKLVERATAAEFGGECALDFGESGVTWRLTAPYEGLAERGRVDLEPAVPPAELL